jgi:hypothetical protein
MIRADPVDDRRRDAHALVGDRALGGAMRQSLIRTARGATLAVASLLCGGTIAFAGFAATDLYLASVGRGGGTGGSNWYTTLWVHNPNSSPANVQFFFLERDRSNTSPSVFNDSIPPGDTFRYDDAVATMFGVEKFGAIRVVSTERLVVNARIYSQAPGAEPGDSQGQFFAGIPASFAIGSGESTDLLGAYQTAPKSQSQFRYNFGFVEVSGGPAKVRVSAVGSSGEVLATRDYDLAGYEPRQFALDNLLPGVDAQNLRLRVDVIAGEGKVIAFGSAVANRSNDPFTTEMQFRDDLLLSNATLTVSHDASLRGDGSEAAPLGIADAGVGARHLADGTAVRVINGMADDVTVKGAEGITVSSAGHELTIAGTQPPTQSCPACDPEHVFGLTVLVTQNAVTAFTVPEGRTRYITGVYPFLSCSGADGYVDLSIGTTPLLTMGFPATSWSSAGGAPLVIPGGKPLVLSTSRDPSCYAYVTITGFEF